MKYDGQMAYEGQMAYDGQMARDGRIIYDEHMRCVARVHYGVQKH